MHLDNQIPLVKRPIIPKILKGKITVVSNCKLKIEEIRLFELSLQCVANHLEKDNIDLDSYYSLNIIFTEYGAFSFHEQDECNNGSQFYSAIYRMGKLRKINNKTFTMFVYIEELTHFFWRIYDETIVKYKVVEILNDVVPNLSIDDLKGCGLNGVD
jgi:hypothetical protein